MPPEPAPGTTELCACLALLSARPQVFRAINPKGVTRNELYGYLHPQARGLAGPVWVGGCAGMSATAAVR